MMRQLSEEYRQYMRALQEPNSALDELRLGIAEVATHSGALFEAFRLALMNGHVAHAEDLFMATHAYLRRHDPPVGWIMSTLTALLSTKNISSVKFLAEKFMPMFRPKCPSLVQTFQQACTPLFFDDDLATIKWLIDNSQKLFGRKFGVSQVEPIKALLAACQKNLPEIADYYYSAWICRFSLQTHTIRQLPIEFQNAKNFATFCDSPTTRTLLRRLFRSAESFSVLQSVPFASTKLRRLSEECRVGDFFRQAELQALLQIDDFEARELQRLAVHFDVTFADADSSVPQQVLRHEFQQAAPELLGAAYCQFVRQHCQQLRDGVKQQFDGYRQQIRENPLVNQAADAGLLQSMDDFLKLLPSTASQVTTRRL